MKQLGGRESPFVLAPRTLHFNTFSSASACSSQKRMSISRYIDVAVVRCS